MVDLQFALFGVWGGGGSNTSIFNLRFLIGHYLVDLIAQFPLHKHSCFILYVVNGVGMHKL